MKSRNQIRIEVLEEMPYASDHEVELEVTERINNQEQIQDHKSPSRYDFSGGYMG